MTALVPEFIPDSTLFPFRSRYFEASAGRVHYVDEGHGPVLLMFHGNATWSFLYRGLITRLRPHFRCVVVDYPGFGLSERPPGYGYTPAEHARIVGEVVRHLDLCEMVVLVHDWGGPIRMAVAVAERERVRGLVLGNAWYWPPTPPFRLFSWVMSTPLGRWMLLRRNFFVETIIPHWTERSLTAAEMNHYRSVQPTPALRVGIAELAAQIRRSRKWLTTLEFDVATHLSELPVLITWPMRDRSFAPLLARVPPSPTTSWSNYPTRGTISSRTPPIR